MLDEDDVAPPTAAATPSTNSTRFIPGSLPFSSRRPASFPRPTAVPIVSKKSDSITETIAAIAVQKLRTLNTSKLKLPTSAKSGVAVMLDGSCATPGPTASQMCLSPHTMLITIATNVPNAIPIKIAPRTFLATRAAVSASVTRKTSTRSVVRSGLIVTTVPCPATTMPPFTNPMIARNSPIPIPIASFRSIGIASKIISRTPVSTRIEITTPSITITPMACGHVSPSWPTSVNATNAFRPRPAAIANGYLPHTPIAIVITPAAKAVTVSTCGNWSEVPVLSGMAPRMAGLRNRM